MGGQRVVAARCAVLVVFLAVCVGLGSAAVAPGNVASTEVRGGDTTHVQMGTQVTTQMNTQVASQGFLVAYHSQCKGADSEVSPCAEEKCSSAPPTDGVWGSWSQWGPCTCGGLQTRHRNVQVHATNGGLVPEGPEEQVGTCVATCHAPLDCQLSAWSSWLECSASCGGGQQSRARFVQREPVNHGLACNANLRETRNCGEVSCAHSVDCVWNHWGEWGACSTPCGSGQQRRHRGVKVKPQGGGQLCTPQSKEEWRPCSNGQCVPDLDCVIGSWAEWSTCMGSCEHGSFMGRKRDVVKHPKGNGKSCTGDVQQSKSCVQEICQTVASDCTFTPWSSWNTCTCECNGQTERQRQIHNHASNGGLQCVGSLHAMEPCNQNAPACSKNTVRNVDCVLTEWSSWSQPAGVCGEYQAARRRDVTVTPSGNGRSCGDTLVEVRAGNAVCADSQTKPVVDCVWHEWGRWSGCSLQCGGGERRRNRDIKTRPENGGQHCEPGASETIEACHTEPCLEPTCVWTVWSEWSTTGMEPVCGLGQVERYRQRRSENGELSWCHGKQKELVDRDYGECAASCKRADCSFSSWTAWSDCPCSAVATRHRRVGAYAQCGGTPCNGRLEESKHCEPKCRETPNKDCRHSDWTAWSACPAVCGSALQKRVRSVTQHTTGYGATCSDADDHDERACVLPACPHKQDCQYGKWRQWSACTKSCGGGNHEKRRSVAVHAHGGGEPCKQAALVVVAPCALQTCPIDGLKDCVLSSWSSWSKCSATCEGGWKSRSRRVASEAVEGGVECEGSLQDWEPCFTQPCTAPLPVDCVLSSWTTWTSCSSDCNGISSSSRSVASIATNGGRQCVGAMSKIRPCNVESRACGLASTDCYMASWSSWSNCKVADSKNCGVGNMDRSRVVAGEASGMSGKGCLGDMAQLEPCEIACSHDVVDCQLGSWTPWTECTRQCAGGQKSRQRGIAVKANKYGAVCDAAMMAETQPCNEWKCKSLATCEWTAWGEWSRSEKECGEDTARRSRRRILIDSATGSEYDGAVEPISDIHQACLGDKAGDHELVQHQLQAVNLGECPPACEPLDCKFSLWAEWGACPCTGLKQRQRVVSQYPRCNGKICDGDLRELTPCARTCDAVPDLDCRYATWTLWSACPNECHGSTQQRFRVVTLHSSGHGAECNEQTDQKRYCKPDYCAFTQDCVYSEWAAWDTCSKVCGGGQRERARHILSRAQHEGEQCAAADMRELAPCNTQDCEVAIRDCKLSSWSAWSSCSSTCGSGFSRRERHIEVHANKNGALCSGDLTEFNDCNKAACNDPVDCRLTAWEEWTSCSSTCNGERGRKRTIQQPALHGGRPCAGEHRMQMSQLEACNTEGCFLSDVSRDCMLSPWALWTQCTATCEGGQRQRSRTVSQPAEHGGKACIGELSHLEQCNTDLCQAAVDCMWGLWGRWSECSQPCGVGSQIRHRDIARVPLDAGKSCSALDSSVMRECNVQQCSAKEQSCVWAPWASWSEPSQKCGWGQQRRVRSLHLVNPQDVYHGQEAADISEGETGCTGTATELRPKDLGPCDAQCSRLDCEFSLWTAWGACPCNGVHSRKRTIAVYPTCGGAQCTGSLEQAETCKPFCKIAPNTDCRYGDWTEWSGCPKTCGGASQTRSRTIADFASGHGKKCSTDYLEENRACATEKCPTPVDCSYQMWTAWSACSKTCGAGERERSREIERPARFGGEDCKGGAMSQIDTCVNVCEEDVVDCQLAEWTAWASCSSSCGKGSSSRSRHISTQASEAGKPCHGRLQEFHDCTSEPCQATVDGLFSDWSPWGQCSCECDGTQSKQRQITQRPRNGGKVLEGPLEWVRACNVKAAKCAGSTKAAVDCQLGAWSTWMSCTQTCGGGYRSRVRRVVSEAKGGGMVCEGPLLEVSECNSVSCIKPPVDCVWAKWSPWSPCSATCGGGQQERARSISQMPENNGVSCTAEGSRVVQPCGTEACGMGAQCAFQAWAEWSACTNLCNGFRKRERNSVIDGTDRRCAGERTEVQPCGGEDKSCSVVCIDAVWGEWTPYGECECLGFQQRRRVVQSHANSCGRAVSGPAHETMPCKPNCVKSVDSQWFPWGEWAGCSATCGGGQRARFRTFSASVGTGKGAMGPSTQTEPCARVSCFRPTDCALKAWTDWSPCSASCDGVSERSRAVLTQPTHGGRSCGEQDLQRVQGCNVGACKLQKVDCLWHHWQEWSSCTVSCGGGVRSRERSYQEALHGGTPCTGDVTTTEACEVDTCLVSPQDCKFSPWEDWSSCSCPCNGYTERSRQVLEHAHRGGHLCQGSTVESKPCNVPNSAQGEACDAAVDCKLSEWSEWNTCSRSCDGGQQVQRRVVLQKPQGGGRACDADIERIRGCNQKLCQQPVDCQLGGWAMWSGCSATCGGGQRGRSRSYLTLAEHGGRPCLSATTSHIEQCGVEQCTTQSVCAWSTWGSWSTCSAQCGGGERRRDRELHPSTMVAGKMGMEAVADMELQLKEQLDNAQHRLEDSTHWTSATFLAAACCVLVGMALVGMSRSQRVRLPSVLRSESSRAANVGAQQVVDGEDALLEGQE